MLHKVPVLAMAVSVDSARLPSKHSVPACPASNYSCPLWSAGLKCAPVQPAKNRVCVLAIIESLPSLFSFRTEAILPLSAEIAPRRYRNVSWLLHAFELMSLETIKGEWKKYREWQSEGEYAVDGDPLWNPRDLDGPIKPIFLGSISGCERRYSIALSTSVAKSAVVAVA